MTFSVILDFLKRNWWILVVIGVLITSELRIHNTKKILEETIESNNKQIQILNTNHEAELKDKSDLILKHKKQLENIENLYNQQTIELAQEKNKRIKIIVKYYDNPEKLISVIQKNYGFKYESN